MDTQVSISLWCYISIYHLYSFVLHYLPFLNLFITMISCLIILRPHRDSNPYLGPFHAWSLLLNQNIKLYQRYTEVSTIIPNDTSNYQFYAIDITEVLNLSYVLFKPDKIQYQQCRTKNPTGIEEHMPLPHRQEHIEDLHPYM